MSEQQYTMMEAERNAASNEYFGERPQIDTMDRRRVFDAGFDRAWKLQHQQKPERKMSAIEWFFRRKPMTPKI